MRVLVCGGRDYGEVPFASASRRASSASITSRMNAAMRFGPTSASMRSATSTGRRTSVGFKFIGGRPMRRPVSDIGKFVNLHSKSDIAY